MKRYYWLVQRDNLVSNSFVADQWDLRGFDQERFFAGEYIRDWPCHVTFCASSLEMDGALDDFVVNNSELPIITPRLKELLTQLDIPNVQLLDVTVFSSIGVAAPCYALNFTRHVAALDLARTEVVRYPRSFSNKRLRGRIQMLFKPTLFSSAVAGLDMFRLDEYPDRLFASEAFRREFRKLGMTGVSFSPVNLS